MNILTNSAAENRLSSVVETNVAPVRYYSGHPRTCTQCNVGVEESVERRGLGYKERLDVRVGVSSSKRKMFVLVDIAANHGDGTILRCLCV